MTLRARRKRTLHAVTLSEAPLALSPSLETAKIFADGLIAAFPGRIRLLRLDPAPPSPGQAANIGIAAATGDLVGVVMDGARMASPALLATARLAWPLAERPVIATAGWHLGPVRHMEAVAAGYDQAAVTGSVNIAGAILPVAMDFSPTAGNVFTIIDNDGSDLVTGEFDSLPNGSVLAVSGRHLRIDYGNDVTLTVLQETPVLNGSAPASVPFGNGIVDGVTITTRRRFSRTSWVGTASRCTRATAVTGTAANISGIAGGILVFGDPMAGSALGVTVQALAFVLVIVAAALMPAPVRAAGAAQTA